MSYLSEAKILSVRLISDMPITQNAGLRRALSVGQTVQHLEFRSVVMLSIYLENNFCCAAWLLCGGLRDGGINRRLVRPEPLAAIAANILSRRPWISNG